jgi:hypothetical protein
MGIWDNSIRIDIQEAGCELNTIMNSGSIKTKVISSPVERI